MKAKLMGVVCAMASVFSVSASATEKHDWSCRDLTNSHAGLFLTMAQTSDEFRYYDAISIILIEPASILPRRDFGPYRVYREKSLNDANILKYVAYGNSITLEIKLNEVSNGYTDALLSGKIENQAISVPLICR